MAEQNIPKHIAIIPDGNRRWAKAKGLGASDGHSNGAKNFTEITETAFKNGVSFLTFWIASVDNLKKRDFLEVNFLIKLLKEYLQKAELAELLNKNEIRFRCRGFWNKIFQDEELSKLIDDLEKQTENYHKGFLTFLFGYDGVTEMLEAFHSSNGKNVTSPNELKELLLTNFLPDVDLLVRTGGEPHNSAGFLMWQTANSQLIFRETLWPDYNSEQLLEDIKEFAKREQRLGA